MFVSNLHDDLLRGDLHHDDLHDDGHDVRGVHDDARDARGARDARDAHSVYYQILGCSDYGHDIRLNRKKYYDYALYARTYFSRWCPFY